MVKINTQRFADKVEEYLIDSNKPEEWFKLNEWTANDSSVSGTLCLKSGTGILNRESIGIRFGYNTLLVMQLFRRAYEHLEESVSPKEYANATAQAMERFAEPFPEDANELCYPHFLLHGLIQPSLEDVVQRFDTNSRIIHETNDSWRNIIKEFGSVDTEGNTKLELVMGVTDDYFGIACLLAKRDERHVSSANGYIAKVSFFLDGAERDIYVMTIQGKRFGYHDPIRANSEQGKQMKLENERKYSRLGNELGMSPRRFVLNKVMQWGREHDYRRIRVIHPSEHGMNIEGHKGFLGNYEPVILKAGIAERNGCYLEADLVRGRSRK
ncbi:MAG: hypothetical protein KJ896_00775 [Nanoarchaeota archaeon]|nr:hypothetical protein [Nanoarchaeota archaeon]